MAAPSKNVLLTGFDAFGGEDVNPSALAVQQLAGETIAGRQIVTAILPCVFGQSVLELKGVMDEVNPELVICVGQAGGRDAINLERIAINLDDAAMPDNAGAQPVDQVISADGPAAYWATLPGKEIVRSLEAKGIRAVVSQSAGTFVCNHVFYRLMQTLKNRPGVRGGFIHVPFLPEQAKGNASSSRQPSMPLEQIVESLRIATMASLL
jgi:pyroglutamyl-peptidase